MLTPRFRAPTVVDPNPQAPPSDADDNPMSPKKRGNAAVIDAYVAAAGGMGTFQWGMLAWLSAIVWPAAGCSALGLVFILESYKAEFPDCDVSLAASAMFFGWMVTSVGLNRVADAHGRKPVVFACLLALVVFGAARPLAPSFFWFVALHVPMGAAIGGGCSMSYVLAMEVLPASHRGFCTSCKATGWALSAVAFALIAQSVTYWRTLCLVAAVPPAMAMATVLVIDESPRFLVSRGMLAAGKDALQSIAAVNGASVPSGTLDDLAPPPARATSGDRPSGVAAIFSNRRLRDSAAVLMLAWFSCAMTYYGLSFMAGGLSGDIYSNFILLNAIEVPASFVASAVAAKFSKPVALSVAVGGAGALLVLLSTGIAGTVQTPLAIGGKFFVSAAWVPAYVLSSETFPVAIRGAGVGLCNTFARLAGMMAPVLAHSLDVEVCSGVFGALGVAAGILALRLPRSTPSALVAAAEPLPVRGDNLINKAGRVVAV